jgi:type IV pilus assembly protein PilZ
MSDQPGSGSEKRIAHRMPIELKVEYKRLNTFLSDYTKNISSGGTFIKTKTPLEVGTEFVFKLHVPTVEPAVEIRGVVKWVTDKDEEPGPGMGIEFRFESDEQREDLRRTVEKLMTASLGERISRNLLSKTEDEKA